MACMTHAMKVRRRLSAGEARYEPKEQVASSVRLLDTSDKVWKMAQRKQGAA